MIRQYPRTAAAVLALSAIGFAGLVANEGYTDKAVIPIPGDVPTYGFGSTVKQDGTRVRMGDITTPPEALRTAVVHLAKDQEQMRACFEGAELYQHEWDAYTTLGYNVGVSAVCRSSIPAKVKAKDYIAACDAILSFYRAQHKDCRIRSNGCYGVWVARQKAHRLCITGEYGQ